MTSLSLRHARRLALARAGLLKPEHTGLPRRASGTGARARAAAQAVITRFGYLQLDTVSVAGVRSHVLVLLSRLDGFEPELGERLLRPGAPLFEYWGHEASWMPLDLYPTMSFRRRKFRHHPWWGDVVGRHPRVARDLLKRIRDEGPLRSADLEGEGGQGWWNLKVAKRVALALWSDGTLAIRERRAFQRTYDLAERVIPANLRARRVPEREAIEMLLLRALAGHGWASTGTLSATWRLRNAAAEVRSALARLEARGAVIPCHLVDGAGRKRAGWVRPADLELAGRLERVRPRCDRGVLLSPFDPLLWDRARVELLFGFRQVLEIFKPAAQREYGYFCLPVLAGERLVARVDLKAERTSGRLHVLARHYEREDSSGRPPAVDVSATEAALERYATSIRLELSVGEAGAPGGVAGDGESSTSERSAVA